MLKPSHPTHHMHRWNSTDTFWFRSVAEVSRYSCKLRGMKSDQVIGSFSPDSSAPAVLLLLLCFNLRAKCFLGDQTELCESRLSGFYL